jgi:NADH:ubiquinone oxidoreductase subunit E/ferredoxin/NAD-dependent dihydropyrimidine dehydrogenase PreA subunit
MDGLKIRVDDVEIKGQRGATILETAENAGIHIPTLCHHRSLSPTGSCRICVVEVEGSGRLIGSCHTPIEEGMAIHTNSAKVIAVRKANIELLMAGHTGPCLNDWKASQCELHNIASELQTGPPRFRVRKPRHYAPEDSNPYIKRDMSKCILCSRCISVCNDLAQKQIFSSAYRGFRSKVIVDFDSPLDKEICRDCLLCLEYCPTSALSRPGQTCIAAKKEKTETIAPHPKSPDRERRHLLPVLKKAEQNFHCVSQGFMTDTAQSMNLSVSDVYGVATFYSFLSTRPTGANIIRACKSLPCYIKNSRTILQCIEDVLGIRPGETTSDRLFSLELVNCIGACDRAPAILINNEVHGNLTPKKISKIIKSYIIEKQPRGE